MHWTHTATSVLHALNTHTTTQKLPCKRTLPTWQHTEIYSSYTTVRNIIDSTTHTKRSPVVTQQYEISLTQQHTQINLQWLHNSMKYHWLNNTQIDLQQLHNSMKNHWLNNTHKQIYSSYTAVWKIIQSTTHANRSTVVTQQHEIHWINNTHKQIYNSYTTVWKIIESTTHTNRSTIVTQQYGISLNQQHNKVLFKLLKYKYTVKLFNNNIYRLTYNPCPSPSTSTFS